MFDDQKGVAIAKISKVYGTNGEIIVRLYDNFPDKPDFKEPFFIKLGGIIVPLFISSFTKQGNTKAVVLFDDFDTEYRTKELIGLELLTLNEDDDDDEMDDDDEVSFEDLVGYTVRDIITGKTGIIKSYIDNPINPIFEVDFQGLEVLIPAIDDLIEVIDTDSEVIDMRIPDGLFELYSSPDNYND